MNGVLTRDLLAPHETAIKVCHRNPFTGKATVRMWWADPNTCDGICRGKIRTKLGPLVDNLHACGCTVRGVDTRTRKALHQLAGGAL